MKSFVKQLNSVTAAKAGKPTYNLDTDEEFGVVGATYYAVAQAGYNYSGRQNIHYKNRKYNTLAAAEAALPSIATTPIVINIIGTWSGNDSNEYTLFNGTATTEINCILVRTIGKARHNGKWSETAYRRSTTWDSIRIDCDWITIDGIQFAGRHTSNDNHYVINIYGGNHAKISNCIVKRTETSSYVGTGIGIGSNYGNYVEIENCIIYDYNQQADDSGIRLNSIGNNFLVSNSTIINCSKGIKPLGIGYNILVRNVLVQSCTDGFTTGSYGSSDYNVSDIASDAPGANSFQHTAVFVDAANDNFHLDKSESRLRGAGTDLSSDFDYDIDKEGRPRWDIGCDEYHTFVATVYDHYVYLNGSTDYISTPDSVANSITGDLDIRVKCAADDWALGTTQCLIGKWTGATNGSWLFEIGNDNKLWLWGSSTGTNYDYAFSPSTIPFANGAVGWVRCSFVASTHTAYFYSSTDYNPDNESGTWTSLGTSTALAYTSFFNAVAPITIGAYDGAEFLAGRVYYAEVRDGIDGTIVARFNASEIDQTETYISNINGQEKWTNNGGTYTSA